MVLIRMEIDGNIVHTIEADGRDSTVYSSRLAMEHKTCQVGFEKVSSSYSQTSNDRILHY